jgi:cytochrome b561
MPRLRLHWRFLIRLESPKMSENMAGKSYESYDSRSIMLHWLTALLVVGLWCVGQIIDWFPKGAPRVNVRSLHVCFGALLGLVIFYRIWWRSTAGRKLPPANQGAVQVLTKLVHWALYLLIVAAVGLGLFNAWVHGVSLFGLAKIPAFDPGNKELHEQIDDLHALAANVLISVAALHAAAGLAHHFIWKDSVLRRMLPGREAQS